METGQHRDLPASTAGLQPLADLLTANGAAGISADYAELQDPCPRFLKLDEQMIMLHRYDDLRRLGANPDISNVPTAIYVERSFGGSPEAPLMPEQISRISHFQSQQLFTAPRPAHDAVKAIFSAWLSPKSMKVLAAQADEAIAAALAGASGAGPFDLLHDVAASAGFRFWQSVLGMTDAETELLRGAVARMGAIVTGRARDNAAIIRADGAVADYFAALLPAISRTLSEGSSPLLNAFAERYAKLDKTIPELPQQVDMAIAANLIDGFHAMALGATICILPLLEDPALIRGLRSDPARVDALVAGALRRTSPVAMILRFAVRTVEYDGMTIPAGTLLLFHWAAGNRDAMRREAPGAAHARPAAPLTFGTGVQICPGRNLVGMFAARTVAALIDRSVSIRPAGPVEWVADSPLISKQFPVRVPVIVEPAGT